MNKGKVRAISIGFFLFTAIALIYQNATLNDNPVKLTSSQDVNCNEGAYTLYGTPSKFYPGKCDLLMSGYEGFPDKSWEDGIHSLWEEEIHWAFEPKEPGKCEKENAVNSKFYPGKCDRTFSSDSERRTIPELSWNDGVHSIRQMEWAGSVYVSGYVAYDPQVPSDNNAPIDENVVKIVLPSEGQIVKKSFFRINTIIPIPLGTCDKWVIFEISKDQNFQYWWAYRSVMGSDFISDSSTFIPVNTSNQLSYDTGTYFLRARCRDSKSERIPILINETLSPIVSFTFETENEDGNGNGDDDWLDRYSVPTDTGVRPGGVLRFNSGREVELTSDGLVVLKKKSGKKKVINKNDRFKWIGGDSFADICGITKEGAVKCRRSVDIVNGADAQWVYRGKMTTVNALKSMASEIDFVVSWLPFVDQLPGSNCQKIDTVWDLCETFVPAGCGYDSDSKKGLCWGYNQTAKTSGSPFNPATFKYEPLKAEIRVVKVKYESESALLRQINSKDEHKKYSNLFEFNIRNFILPYAFGESPNLLEIKAGNLFLGPNQFVQIQNYSLKMHESGDLLLSRIPGGEVVWTSKSKNFCQKKPCSAYFSQSGELSIMDNVGRKFWTAGVSGGSKLILQNEHPQLRIVDQVNNMVWSLPQSGYFIPNAFTRYEFDPGDLDLEAGEFLETERNRLVMQGDGNLVLYVKKNGRAAWSSKTSSACGFGAAQCSLSFNDVGNLVITREDGCEVWESVTSAPNGRFIFRDEAPKLRVLGQDGHVHWELPGPGKLKSSCLPNKLEWPAGGLVLKQGESKELGKFRLDMQGDGNLVVIKKENEKPVWASGTNKACNDGKDSCAAIFQGDGNFVIVQENGSGCPVWATQTQGSNSKIVFRDESPWLRIVSGSGEQKWSSNQRGELRTCKKQWGAGGLVLAQGQSVELDEHKLVMQTDGNLVMRRKSDNADVWNAGSNVICENGAQNCKLTYQGDGNLVIRRADGCAAWATDTGFKNAAINIRDKDPYLKIVGQDGTVHWQTPNRGSLKSCLPQRLEWATSSGFKLGQNQAVEIEKLKLVMQGDGNLCVYHKPTAKNLWCSYTNIACGNGTENCSVYFQGDGNLVIYRAKGCPVWATQTQGNNAKFVFRDEAPRLRIVGQDGHVHWDNSMAGKNLSCEVYEGLFRLADGSIFYSNRANAQYCYYPGWDQFRIQTGRKNIDGIPLWGGLPWWQNVGSCGEKPIPAGLFRIGGAIYNSNGWAYCAYTSWDNYVDCAERNDLNGVDWYSGIPSVMTNHGGCTCLPSKLEWGPNGLALGPNQAVETKHRKLVMQGDGNLCVYNKDNGSATWCSYTHVACGNGPNCYMVYQGDGNLVIYNYGGGKAPWASGTTIKNPGNLVLRDDAPALRIKNGSDTLIWYRPQ